MGYKNKREQREYQREWYQKNKERYRLISRISKDKRKKWLQEKKDASCVDCGIKYHYCIMDFDHREGEIKLERLGSMIYTASWEKLEQEVKKCDLVCSNCHRLRTWKRLMELV